MLSNLKGFGFQWCFHVELVDGLVLACRLGRLASTCRWHVLAPGLLITKSTDTPPAAYLLALPALLARNQLVYNTLASIDSTCSTSRVGHGVGQTGSRVGRVFASGKQATSRPTRQRRPACGSSGRRAETRIKRNESLSIAAATKLAS